MAGKTASRDNSIARLLPGIVKDHGWEQQLELHSIFPRWEELVGEERSGFARPLKIERGVLWLEVDNSVWLQQLQYDKPELLALLNGVLRDTRLKDIKMVLPKGRAAAADDDASKPPVRFVAPSAEKVAAFRRQVECIADQNCRDALMQFWYLAQACRRTEK